MYLVMWQAGVEDGMHAGEVTGGPGGVGGEGAAFTFSTSWFLFRPLISGAAHTFALGPQNDLWGSE